MNYSQASEMASAFRTIGGFSSVEVDHHGFWSEHSEALDNDGQWRVNLWAVNARSGNRNLEVVREYTADKKQIARLARAAKGKATAADKAAFARAAAERENA